MKEDYNDNEIGFELSADIVIRPVVTVDIGSDVRGEEEENQKEDGEISKETVLKKASNVKRKRISFVLLHAVLILLTLWIFLLALKVMGNSFNVIGGRSSTSLFNAIQNPISGLMVGILITVVVQSSSTSSSIVVGLVGTGLMSVNNAVYTIMGCNIGTSITNTLVSLSNLNHSENFQRSFAAATVHDCFNFMNILILLPLEWIVSSMTVSKEGPIVLLTTLITKSILNSGSAANKSLDFKSPIDPLVGPLASKIISVNKEILVCSALGEPQLESCLFTETTTNASFDEETLSSTTSIPLEKCNVNYFICGNEEAYESSVIAYKENVLSQSLIKPKCLFGVFENELFAGWLGVLFSLALLYGALYCLVSLLKRVLMDTVKTSIQKVLGYNGYIAIVIGILLTILLQSSSVTTSLLTPLAGLGAITLEAMYPMTLGANIGTTFTAILAAFVIFTFPALQIAFCHLFINLIGVLFFYIIPCTRQYPLQMARTLGKLTRVGKWFAFTYIIFAFFVGPGYILLLSELCLSNNRGWFILGILLTILTLLFITGGTYYAIKRGLWRKLMDRIDLQDKANEDGVN